MPQGGKGPTQCRKRKASGVFVIFVPFISVWSEQRSDRIGISSKEGRGEPAIDHQA
jgi:hypothetical protein